MKVRIIPKFSKFKEPNRFNVAYGGRGGGRSWSIARWFIVQAVSEEKRILCTREFQNSIRESVHKLLSDQIKMLGYDDYFNIERNSIKCLNGSEFIFKGLRHNAAEIKSTEGIDLCWVEEAENVSRDSWDYLIPTIRTEGSQIWISFNPEDEDGETYRRFVKECDESMILVKTTYRDNPWLPKILEETAERDKRHDPDKYDWIWEGNPRKLTEARILKRWRVEDFETPEDVERFYYGIDWGFAHDPTVMTRSWKRDRKLYIDHEAYGVGVELEELEELFRSVPGSDKWPAYADPSRPETISYMRRRGFRIMPAEAWKGSVEDGIEYLRNFDEIIIHERCHHTAQEAKLYSYKVDKSTNEVLPIVLDAYNHCIDSIRYGHCKEIRKRRVQIFI